MAIAQLGFCPGTLPRCHIAFNAFMALDCYHQPGHQQGGRSAMRGFAHRECHGVMLRMLKGFQMSSRAQSSRRGLLPVWSRGCRLFHAMKPMAHGEAWVTYLLDLDAMKRQSCCRAGEEGEKFSQEMGRWDSRMSWGS